VNESSIITALVAILKIAGGGGIGLVAILALVMMLCPAVAVWLIMRSNRELGVNIQKDHDDSERRFEKLRADSEKRFESVVRMYEDNVLLVKNYDKTADGLQGVIHLSTQAMTKLVEKINNNHFCPIVRERSTPSGE
jgi:uncharacterized protein (DUF58 family)